VIARITFTLAKLVKEAVVAPSGFNWQAKVTFPCGGVPSGKVSNSFNLLWSGTGTPAVSDLDAAQAAISAFYKTAHSPEIALNQFLGVQVQRGLLNTETAFYNVDIGADTNQLGSPVHVVMWDVAGSPSGTALPNEVACVYSFRADYGTDPEHLGTQRPRAQDRGRIFFGPLTTASMVNTAGAVSGTTFSKLSLGLVNSLLLAGTALHSQLIAATWHLAVWSRHDKVYKQAVMHAVDQSFDTQRKRAIDEPLQSWAAF
jgi:hypothetical protein